jgi:hypothetical protein
MPLLNVVMLTEKTSEAGACEITFDWFWHRKGYRVNKQCRLIMKDGELLWNFTNR